MTTTVDYALMAGASYISTRAEINQFPTPSGWVGSKHDTPPGGSGFEAVTFIKGTEIVISFAGTDSPGDLFADLALAAGNRYHVEQFKTRGCGELAMAKGL